MKPLLTWIPRTSRVTVRSLLLFFLSTPAVLASPPDWQLSPQGLGPIKIGMTLQQAQTSANSKITKSQPDNSMGEDASCFTTNFYDKKLSGISLMISNGRIVRINISSPNYSTNKGVRIKDDESKLIKAYPSIRREPHKYDSKGHYFTVYTPPSNAIRFETNGQQITLIYAGKKKEVSYVEDCL